MYAKKVNAIRSYRRSAISINVFQAQALNDRVKETSSNL